MNSSPENNEKLERLIHRTLRELPARRAPRSLESRVLAELERRAALSWWHLSFAHWPGAVRAAFFVLSAAVAAGLVAAIFVMTRSTGSAALASGIADHFAWLSTARGLYDTAAGATGAVWRAIPPLWLYGTLAFVAACYTTLVGVGAAAYRTFQAQR